MMITQLEERTSKRNRIYKHISRIKDYESFTELPPITIEIFPTNNCNSSCKFCAFRNLKNGESIDRIAFNRLINDIIKLKVKAVVFAGGGEPTVYPDLADGINRLSDNGIEVGVITNALQIDDFTKKAIKRCSWVRFSILTSDSIRYQRLTGLTQAQFEQAKKNIKDICEERPCSLITSLLMLVDNSNINQSDFFKFIDLGKMLGVDQVFFSELIEDFGKYKLNRQAIYDSINNIKSYSKKQNIVTNINKFIEGDKMKCIGKSRNEECEVSKRNLITHINAKGDVFPCIGLALAEHKPVGNVMNQSLIEMFNSDSIRLYNDEIHNCECQYCKNQNMKNEVQILLTTSTIKPVNDLHYNFL